MFLRNEVELTGKTISTSDFTAQVDVNGTAVVINNDGSPMLLTHENLISILGHDVEAKVVDSYGNVRAEDVEVISRLGFRGKKFEYSERLKIFYQHNGRPIVKTLYGAPVAVDQYGHPFHVEALNQKQYYSLEGKIVTLNRDHTVKNTLGSKLRVPIFVVKGSSTLTLSYQDSKYSLADLEGKCLLFDQSGSVIDDQRVMKFDRLVKGVIAKRFPLKQSIEGSYYYEDLLNKGREVVVKALIKFDAEKCINTVSKNDKRKKVSDQERLNYKIENQSAAIEAGEMNWVQQPLFSEFRRLAWKSSEKYMDGRTISLEIVSLKAGKKKGNHNIFDMLSECSESLFDDPEGITIGSIEDKSENNVLDDIILPDSTNEDYLFNVDQARSDYEDFIELIEKNENKVSQSQLDGMVQKALLSLSDDRRDDLQALLKARKYSSEISLKTDEELFEEYESASTNDFSQDLDSDNDSAEEE
jgi:hypothetical protein